MFNVGQSVKVLVYSGKSGMVYQKGKIVEVDTAINSGETVYKVRLDSGESHLYLESYIVGINPVAVRKTRNEIIDARNTYGINI
jgi:hypothetical protein